VVYEVVIGVGSVVVPVVLWAFDRWRPPQKDRPKVSVASSSEEDQTETG
jgi:hypothetical protein